MNTAVYIYRYSRDIAYSKTMDASNLVDAATRHVRFLRQVHATGVSLRPPSAHEFRRYEKCWLPLLKILYANGTLEGAVLSPPLDVAWLWHCHRLAPAAYAKLCAQRFGGQLDCPAAAFSVVTGEDSLTQRLWEEHFPDEPFLSQVLEPIGVGCQWDAEVYVSQGTGLFRAIRIFRSCPNPTARHHRRNSRLRRDRWIRRGRVLPTAVFVPLASVWSPIRERSVP